MYKWNLSLLSIGIKISIRVKTDPESISDPKYAWCTKHAAIWYELILSRKGINQNTQFISMKRLYVRNIILTYINLPYISRNVNKYPLHNLRNIHTQVWFWFKILLNNTIFAKRRKPFIPAKIYLPIYMYYRYIFSYTQIIAFHFYSLHD